MLILTLKELKVSIEAFYSLISINKTFVVLNSYINDEGEPWAMVRFLRCKLKVVGSKCETIFLLVGISLHTCNLPRPAIAELHALGCPF